MRTRRPQDRWCLARYSDYPTEVGPSVGSWHRWRWQAWLARPPYPGEWHVMSSEQLDAEWRKVDWWNGDLR